MMSQLQPALVLQRSFENCHSTDSTPWKTKSPTDASQMELFTIGRIAVEYGGIIFRSQNRSVNVGLRLV